MDSMDDSKEYILKKETVKFKKSAFSEPKGELVLTNRRVYFSKKKNNLFDVDLEKIVNVKSHKAFSAGVRVIEITYMTGKGKEEKVKFTYTTLASFAHSVDWGTHDENELKDFEVAIERAREKISS